MTYSQRRRIFKFITFIGSEWVTPFILGWLLSFVSATIAWVEMLESMDKASFSVCVLPTNHEAQK
jgi:hypothetical protein